MAAAKSFAKGQIVLEAGERKNYTQYDICKNVDIANAEKFFNLDLPQFGPYKHQYSRNGRHLLLGGQRGHAALMDWVTKRLLCEFNTKESTKDLTFLHSENMFALAQHKWTYIYDNQGLELHCLKCIDRGVSLQFLPFHFLLVAGSAASYLQWIDTSVGKKVAGFATGLGCLDVMCQNPRNATVLLGHGEGNVTMWSPNVSEPLARVHCHNSPTRCVTVDHTGNYMATCGVDRRLKIWDLRTYRSLHCVTLGTSFTSVAFSQTGLLAGGCGQVVQIFENVTTHGIKEEYLSHTLRDSVKSLHFCPFEDVLGVGHAKGFCSMLAPGSAEANYDAMEANPFQTKKQRREAEVKMLLDKIPPELITLNDELVANIDDRDSGARAVKEKTKFKPRNKTKGKSKTGKIEKRKQGVRMENKLREVRDEKLKKSKKQLDAAGKKKEKLKKKRSKSSQLLDIFK